MCLSIPSKIISITGDMAQADIGGTLISTGLQLLEDAKVGDYVLIHSGFAIQKLSEEDALETLRLFQELGEIDEEIRKSQK